MTDQPPPRTPRRKPQAANENSGSPQTSAPVQISCRWNPSARRALGSLAVNFSVRALNGAARAALKATLADAPPLLGALRTHLEALKSPRLDVDLTFVDDAEMRELNARFRSKDKPTDVLSFPLWENADFFPPGVPISTNKENVALGDLVISLETAAHQAQELKHDLRAEIAFLSVHGALHLLGYDHGDGGARRKMFAMQNQIFERVRGERGF